MFYTLHSYDSLNNFFESIVFLIFQTYILIDHINSVYHSQYTLVNLAPMWKNPEG